MNRITATTSRLRSLRSAVAMAAFAATSLTAFGAQAATGPYRWSADRQVIQATYRADLADCKAGRTTEDLSTCQYEARSVRRDALAELRYGSAAPAPATVSAEPPKPDEAAATVAAAAAVAAVNNQPASLQASTLEPSTMTASVGQSLPMEDAPPSTPTVAQMASTDEPAAAAIETVAVQELPALAPAPAPAPTPSAASSLNTEVGSASAPEISVWAKQQPE